MSLVVVGDYAIDPTRVISVGPIGSANGPDHSRTLINVNMGDWTASYQVPQEVMSCEDIVTAINLAAAANQIAGKEPTQ